jgi:hypothetical protein
VPIVKRRKNAEEEDPPYEEEVSASEDDDSNQEEEILEEEEEEVGDESDESSSIEEELPSTSKTLKEHVIDVKKKKGLKRKPDKKQSSPPTKKPKEVAPTPTPNQVRKVKKPVKKVRVVDKTEENKKTSNVSVEYNDKNVDYNLYNEAPEHIKNLKIKISSNVIMLCRMIEATGNTSQGLTYDYAALSFVRQSKNGKAYEFNLPLNLAPSILKGITLLIKQNPKFFDKHLMQSVVPEEIE